MKKTYFYRHPNIRAYATTSTLTDLENTDLNQADVVLGLTKLTVWWGGIINQAVKQLF